MISRDWDWSDIVNPQLVERALAHQEERVRRRARANDDPATEHDDPRPVAA